MTAIISLIAVAVLSLSAGFFVLSTGRRKPESGKPADHKLNIRKAPNLAVQEVNDDPPEGLSDLEGAALLLEERDPMDIYLDKTSPRRSGRRPEVGSFGRDSPSIAISRAQRPRKRPREMIVVWTKPKTQRQTRNSSIL